MTDDPTKTGPEQVEREEGRGTFDPLTRFLRGIPGANVTERSPFTVPIKGDLIFVVSNNELTITLEIDMPEGDTPYRLTLPPRPLYSFGSPQNLNTYLAALKRNYFNALRPRLTQEAAAILQAVSIGLYFMLNPGAGDRQSIIEGYTKEVVGTLNEMLAELPVKLKPGTWSKIALRDAVAVAAYRLIQQNVTGRALNLNAVNEQMRAEHGVQAPQSGEALRKQLDERGLSWRQIKAEVERYAASSLSTDVSQDKNGDEEGAKKSGFARKKA